MTVGIDLIHFATSDYFLGLDTFAKQKKVDLDKYTIGIGQEKMSIAPPDEDIITLAAKAADPILQQIDKNSITSVLFATESGVDQSKSAGAFLHGLLELPNRCRVVEFKHACYAGTAALQMATKLVAADSKEKILVIAADIAKYDVDSSGEATQGCGAVAMLITDSPRILAIEPGSGYHTEDLNDFWRPNHRETALVDGKYSTKVYLNSLKHAWEYFVDETGRQFEDIDCFCYHIPFTRMADKAHKTLIKKAGVQIDEPAFNRQTQAGLKYNRILGNSYSASLYIGFCSFMDNAEDDLSGKRFGFFSYGSGAVGEFFSGVIQPGYEQYLMTDSHRQQIDSREPLSYSQYLSFYHSIKLNVETIHFPITNKGKYRFTGIEHYIRQYKKQA